MHHLPSIHNKSEKQNKNDNNKKTLLLWTDDYLEINTLEKEREEMQEELGKSVKT